MLYIGYNRANLGFRSLGEGNEARVENRVEEPLI
ncbi:MAG: hypothetical protein ACI9GK_000948 [Devosia sp.]|jgi:hypothetical protein